MSSPQAINEGHKDRRFGMPGWVVQNIERLNTPTDFGQYAYSPPETDGFLSEFPVALETSEISSSSKITAETSGFSNSLSEEKVFKQSKKNDLSELKLPLKKIDNLQKPLSPRHQSLLEALKCDDIIYSSPETTPQSTPQPSPAPQRKVSFSSIDNSTVQSNPEKWFYLGGKEKNKLMQMEGKHETLHLQTALDARKKKYEEKEKNAKPKFSNRDHAKLAISNFDLNAISPSSW